MEALDGEYAWAEIKAWDGTHLRFVRESCRHTQVVDVRAVTGQLVAHLCLVCDQQLP